MTGSLFAQFDPTAASARLDQIEATWKAESQQGVSRYAGTEWLKAAQATLTEDSTTVYDHYRQGLADTLGICPLHCTHYAIEGLRAGLGEVEFARFDSIHESIWKKREYAGWSTAYVLVKYFGWKAVAVVAPYSTEYEQVKGSFDTRKRYPVWRQPDVPLEELFIYPKEKEAIDSVLTKQAFGWGFSIQGWHTWVTLHDTLDECNWLGSPSRMYEAEGALPLFIHTRFIEYTDYDSHVICFPTEN